MLLSPKKVSYQLLFVINEQLCRYEKDFEVSELENMVDMGEEETALLGKQIFGKWRDKYRHDRKWYQH